MRQCLVKCFWVLVVLLLQYHWCCLGCLEEERIALLKFKASYNWNEILYGDPFPSWVLEKKNNSNSGRGDCCSWERVQCHATTGRVIELSLEDIAGAYEDYRQKNICYLNVTIFSTFKELRHLNLSYNSFDGWIENEGFERLAGLRKLEVLDLSGNNFNESILPSLAELKSLKTLSLYSNFYSQGLHLQEILSTLHNLKSLDLSYNGLETSSQKMQGSSSSVGVGKLEALYLDGNHFDNTILPFLGTLTSLRTLSLLYNQLKGLLHLEELSNLHNLKSLDLSLSVGNRSSQTMQALGKLHHLHSLDLSFDELECFSLAIFQESANLSDLQSLDLSQNNFKCSSQVIFQELSNLHNLKSLDLSDNQLNGSFQTIQALGKLHHLQSLDLGMNNFECSSLAIFQESANLSDLQSLDLSGNNMNCSSQAIRALCGLKRLQKLYLSANNFEGELPLCLKNLTSLTELDLSQNQFRGNIPSSLITSLLSLSYINLRDNDFEGTFTFQSFANLSKLEAIDLTNAGDKLEIGSDQHLPWPPLFQLKHLFLSNCKFSKQMSDAIPEFLSNQYQLRGVDLSGCNLVGSFPSWLLENNRRLASLYLNHNSLRGNFLLPSYVHTATWNIDISNNCIDGLLQENIGNIFPSIMELNLSMNSFEGGIPASIGNMSSLQNLDLSSNKFTGEIPKHMALGCYQLHFLAISNNRLHGQVSPPHLNFTSLQVLKLDNNSFSGNILSGLSNSKYLLVLDINNNRITGRIPRWIGNLTSLTIINMGGNLLQGNIPVEFQTLMSLQLVDLSQNHLSGSMVSILSSTELRCLHLQGNGFNSSPSHYSTVNNSNLVILDMRNNDLDGGISDWISLGFIGLRILLLQGNHFSGTIPNHLCQLNHIRLMDLSHNSLSGSIPRCLNNISFGRMQEVKSMSVVPIQYDFVNHAPIEDKPEEIEFTTKSWSGVYKGDILNYMSGLDLAHNDLTGDIPHEVGTLNELHALNLSHNQLSGSIPKTFSNLKQIESLDLSYNRLSGEIPSQLVVLNNLEVFIVAYNNLSGKTLELKEQFSTFDCTSYEGNPSLCVQLSSDASSGCSNCSNTYGESTNNTTTISSAVVDSESGIDMSAFIASFVASYLICLLGIATIFYINPYWRRIWFHFIEECIYSSYDILSDIYCKIYIYVGRFRLFIWKLLSR